jgi:hypothetical protein
LSFQVDDPVLNTVVCYDSGLHTQDTDPVSSPILQFKAHNFVIGSKVVYNTVTYTVVGLKGAGSDYSNNRDFGAFGSGADSSGTNLGLLTGTVTFPKTFKYIEKNAFRRQNNITRVYFNEGLTSIGEAAFYQCNNLTAISLPSTFSS